MIIKITSFGEVFIIKLWRNEKVIGKEEPITVGFETHRLMMNYIRKITKD